MAVEYLPKNAFNETTYQSLLVIAENYRLARPPRIRMCLHCLMSVFHINPPTQTRIRTHLQIGSLLFKYTENTQLALSHLQAAVTLSSEFMGDGVTHFEAVSLLAKTFCKLSMPEKGKPFLRGGITASQHNTYWHARLLLQLACLHHDEGDHLSTRQLLDVGAELASNCGSDYLRILFLLSKGMVLLVEQNLDEVNIVLSMCGQLIDGIKNSSPIQVESHKVFFLTLQVAHLLSGGQVKSVNSSLKQLQQSIQEITLLPLSATSLVPPDSSGNIKEIQEVEEITNKLTSTDGFLWLQREPMCILVYLVTVTHSLLAGYLSKAQKYTDKALKQIKEVKETDSNPLLIQLELIFLEHMAQCHLVMCDKKSALEKITQGCKLCMTYPNVIAITRHTTQMHTLLGMYCMSMNYLDVAEEHLQIAVKKSVRSEQVMTNMLNLAMVYMHNYQMSNGDIPQVKQQELMSILNQINLETVSVKSRNLKAAAFFVKGMFSFFQSGYSDAKRFLRETLKMANAQDLNRLTACALVLLGHIHLSVGNHQESLNMVIPALQLADKIPDLSIKLWASALLRDIYKLFGDEKNFSEYKSMYESLAGQLLNDHYTSAESARHKIIKWLKEDLPPKEAFEEMVVAKEEIKASDYGELPAKRVKSPGSSIAHPSRQNLPMVQKKAKTDVNSSLCVPGHIQIPDETQKNTYEDINTHHPDFKVKSGKGLGNFSMDQITRHAPSQKTTQGMVPPTDMISSNYISQDIGFHPRTSYFPPQTGVYLGNNKYSHTSPKKELTTSTSKRNPQMSSTQISAEAQSFPSSQQNADLIMANSNHGQTLNRYHMYQRGQLSKHEPSLLPPQPHLDSLPSDHHSDMSVVKQSGTNPYPSTKLLATGIGYGDVSNVSQHFSEKTQHLQQQALLQHHLQISQFSHPNGNALHNPYQHGATNLLAQQNLAARYSLENKLDMQLNPNLQQQHAWVANQGHMYNPNTNSYTWK